MEFIRRIAETEEEVMKLKNNFKRILSGVMSAAMAATLLPSLPAVAEEAAEKYPYTMFAASDTEGAITINANNFCVNGNIATNGTIVSSGNMNVNGTKTENADEEMIYIFDKIDSAYFSGNNVDEYSEDYTLEEINININDPLEVEGNATLTGNININTALKAFEDVTLNGEVKNTNNSVIFSKYGDIVIDSQNVNLNGLVYAPFGNVEITAQNLNLNNVVIIADTITFNCPSVNANYSESMAEFTGIISEPLNIPYEEWKYMKDENLNDFPDFFEDLNNWSKLKDTDGDGLPDCVEQYMGSNPELTDTDEDGLDDYYEVFVTYTAPANPDSDNNGVNDGNEDFDEDGLTNLEEYILTTDPWNEDSDGDGIKDGEEINTYGTDPLKKDTDDDGLEDNDEIYLGTDPTNPDTDGNGILDGDEKFYQTFTHIVENEDCAVEEVIVSMEGTGNLQRNTTVESMMNIDMLSTNVAGLVGEPFEIESEATFDKATISFKIDQSKLGETAFDNLMFLWYDEENDKYVELETIYDEEKSIVSIETTHFSRYMVVDKYQWFEAWSKELNYTSISYEKSICYSVLAVDCSGSMKTYDPITIIPPSSAPYRAINSCERQKAVSGFTSSLDNDDKAAIVTFESSASTACELTDNKTDLYWASASFYNGGGTSFDAALRKSIDILKSSTGGTRKKIILLSDGYSSVSDSILNEAKSEYIKVYTVGIGNCSDSVLSKIATETGGEYFKAYNASELLSIYSQIGITDDFDTTDTDGDGLYDAVEAVGIRLQNGNIIYTDPTTKHTDSDGLEDGEEIDPTPIKSERAEYNDDGTVKTVKGYYFVMKSDPREEDTDGDKYDDNIDPNPMKSDVTVTRLKSDYLSVDYATASSLPEYISWKNHLGTDAKSENISFGGNQSWFERVSGVDKDNPEYIAAQGCGLIAMADTMLYMSRKDSNYETSLTSSVSKNNPVTFEEYRDYVVAFNNEYVKLDVAIDLDIYFLWWKLGNIYTNTNDGNMGDILNDYFESNDIDLEAKWCYVENGICAEGHWFEEGTRARRIRDMLKDDIPAIISVGPGDGIKAYDIDTSSKVPAYTDANQSISNHYFTITAVIDDKIKQKNGDYDAVMYEVSTWGQKYYISEKEIRDYISTHSSLFTNVLYIEEK